MKSFCRLLSGFVVSAVLALGCRAGEPAGSDTLTTTASGLQYRVTAHGEGAVPRLGQVVIAHYVGTLADGTVFDSSRRRGQPFAFTLGKKQVIKGWEEAFAFLHVGDRAVLVVPPELAYGAKARGLIPANATLRFEVELLDVKDRGLADLLQEILDTAGLDAARARYAELKAGGFASAYLNEAQMNALGYRCLSAGRLPEALAVFRWNVELFPSSGNVYDSLGEAEVKNGDRAASLRDYAKSLELDPSNRNAERMLAEIRAAGDAPGALAQMQARMELNDAINAAYETAEKQGYDVPALRARIDAFLARYPDDRAAADLVGNFFYYAESAGLAQAKPQWAAFLQHPNPAVRQRAEQKMQLAKLLEAPLEMSFTAADGRKVDLAALRGKVVLVDFWATWCGPCVAEIPNVVAAYEKYHARGFEVVGVSFDQAPDPARPAKRQKTAAQVLAFTAEHGMPWPQYYDGTYWENPYGKQYGIRGIPAMFLLDREGRVVSTNARGPKLEQEVTRLLGAE
jgi:thiol-disulfide isomerase/thioredoxin